MNTDNILVSICVTTYNHGDFIQQALDGCIMQKTNFDFEILINDDASTDKTVEILKNYKEVYSDIIKPVFQTENQYSKGVRPMAELVYPRAKGKYIAICEGDDFWTDPNKLQTQVDFLENHPDYAICFHPVKIFNEEKQKFVNDYMTGVVSDSTTINDLAFGNFIHTPSVVFRNISNDFPEDLYKSAVGDYFLFMILAKSGKIKRLDEKMAVYRMHKGGVWGLKSALNRYENWLETLSLLKNNFTENETVITNLNLQEKGIIEKALRTCLRERSNKTEEWSKRLALNTNGQYAANFLNITRKEIRKDKRIDKKIMRKIRRFFS